MTIVSSKVIEDAPQIDGRRAITEIHIDDAGEVFRVYYLTEADADVDAMMAARVPDIEAQLDAAILAKELAAKIESAETKVVAYIQGADTATLKASVLMTDDEIALYKATK